MREVRCESNPNRNFETKNSYSVVINLATSDCAYGGFPKHGALVITSKSYAAFISVLSAVRRAVYARGKHREVQNGKGPNGDREKFE